jgi:alanine dehydrogenase
MTALATFGVVRRSRKEHEFRLPIHPRHFDRIDGDTASRLVFETGYGDPFGISDSALMQRFGGVASREEILATCDGVLLTKPMPDDLRELKEGGVLWGWPHCVQQREITDIAVERKQTLLAFESMHHWNAGGFRDLHLFYRNNEMAGYCAVLHAFDLYGIDGSFGPPQSAVVLSLGSASRGAIRGLFGRGISDITVYTLRPPILVRDRVHGCTYGRMVADEHKRMWAVAEDGTRRPMIDVLGETDLIVNGILQDTNDPIMFVQPGEEDRLQLNCLIIDVSCDLAMGFPFARPTSFEQPTFSVGGVTYYAVDHTPSHLWRSATWEISTVVVDFLGRVLGGPEAWAADETLRRAIEIQGGEILNEKILSYRQQ